MNVPSTFRLSSPATTTFLRDLDPSPSNPFLGIISFLQALHLYIKAFSDHSPDYSLLSRVCDLAASVHFFRSWLAHLRAQGGDINSSFITQNAWEGIELSFHGLIFLIILLRNEGVHLHPFLLGSQVLERLFRLIRAYSPNSSTVININSLGFLRRVQCIALDSTFESQQNVRRQHHRRHAGDYQSPPFQV